MYIVYIHNNEVYVQDKDMEGCTDGTCFLTGQRFFECKPGRGVYFPLVNLQSDLRSMDPVSAVGADDLENRKSGKGR